MASSGHLLAENIQKSMCAPAEELAALTRITRRGLGLLPPPYELRTRLGRLIIIIHHYHIIIVVYYDTIIGKNRHKIGTSTCRYTTVW